MRLLRTRTLIEVGQFPQSAIMMQIRQQVEKAIQSIDNPPGTGMFTLYQEKQANGVKPIKEAFIKTLEEFGWKGEARIPVEDALKPGPIDAAYPIGGKHFAVEWETGNISSSHRAVNKMVLGLLNGTLIGGILVLPSREMYTYLTDRVGNFKELEPYLPVWEKANYPITEGLLQIIEVEHDSLSMEVPKIAKGTDGRALV